MVGEVSEIRNSDAVIGREKYLYLFDGCQARVGMV